MRTQTCFAADRGHVGLIQPVAANNAKKESIPPTLPGANPALHARTANTVVQRLRLLHYGMCSAEGVRSPFVCGFCRRLILMLQTDSTLTDSQISKAGLSPRRFVLICRATDWMVRGGGRHASTDVSRHLRCRALRTPRTVVTSRARRFGWSLACSNGSIADATCALESALRRTEGSSSATSQRPPWPDYDSNPTRNGGVTTKNGRPAGFCTCCMKKCSRAAPRSLPASR